MLKKIVLVLLLFISLIFGKADAVNLYIDNQVVDFSNELIIRNGVTKIPIRRVSNTFNAKVDWNSKNKEVLLKHQDKEIKFRINHKKCFINNREIKLNEPSELVNGVTYVPLRLISKVFGCEIDFNSELKRIDINKTQNIHIATPLAFDKLKNHIYVYSQGNNFKNEKSLVRKLTIIDSKSGKIIKRVDDLLSEETTLTIYKNFLYQYRFIPSLESFGLTKQNLKDLESIIVFESTLNESNKDIRVIGAVNDYLYLNTTKEIKRVNLISQNFETIYIGNVEDVHLRDEDLIFIDNDKIVKLSHNGDNEMTLVDNIDTNFSKGVKDYQLRILDNSAYYYNRNHIYKIDLITGIKERYLTNYGNYFNIIKINKEIDSERLKELVTSFLPTKDDLYLSEVNEESVNPKDYLSGQEYDKTTKKMNNIEKKSFKKWYRKFNQRFFGLGSIDQDVLVCESYDYRFGINGAVFPNINYLTSYGDHLYIEKVYQGNLSYFRYNLLTKEIKPFVYNIKHFKYD